MRLTVMPALMSIALVGCADSHSLTRAPGGTNSLSRQASAYVAVTKDGSYGDTTYVGSGAQAAQAVAAAFAPYVTRITVGVKTEDFDAARQSAKTGAYTYLLYPEILHWEDRTTEWSGRPDLVSVKVSVVGAEAGNILDSAVVGGKSGLWTFGGDRPEMLLPKPLSDYAMSVFGK